MKYPSFIVYALMAVLWTVITALTAFILLSNESKPSLATINLNKVVAVNESVLASKNLNPEELSVEAKVFAVRLKSEIESLQANCDCTLLVSSAVITPSKLPDLTQELLDRLGMDEITIAGAEAVMNERMKSLHFSKDSLR